ncbi:Cell wall protein RBT1, partial [Candida tropicalis]
MRFATTQLVSLAFYLVSIEATYAISGLFDCIPKTEVPVCPTLDLYTDTSVSVGSKREDQFEDDLEKRTFLNAGLNLGASVGSSAGINAAFVVTGAKKLPDGNYGITCNFKSHSAKNLKSSFASKIQNLKIVGTGCGDVPLYGKGCTKYVANPFDWSASFKVKPQVINGKCCLPADFQIVTDFKSNCLQLDAIKQIFGGDKLIYKLNTIGSAMETFDSNLLFKSQCDFFGIKRDLENIEQYDNVGITHSKRTLGVFLDLLKSVSGGGGCNTINQFCWDCDCDTTTPTTSSTAVCTECEGTTSTGTSSILSSSSTGQSTTCTTKKTTPVTTEETTPITTEE